MRTDIWHTLPAWTLGLGVAGLAGATATAAGGKAASALGLAVAVLAAGAGLARGWLRLRHDARRAGVLAAALDGDPRACLLLDGRGREILRNGAARLLFGPASDPLAPLMARTGDDERARDALERLKAAAAAATPRHADLPLPTPAGGRDWLRIEIRPAGRDGALLWSATDIAPERAIEETLRRETEALADFLDFLPVGCYSADANGVLRRVNQRLAEWLGQSPAALIGRNLADVLGTVPDPEQGRSEIQVRGRGDEMFQALVSHSVFDDGGETLTRSAVMRDPVPEHLWERALRAAERRFGWLFDDAPVGIALIDLDGSIGTCNLALQSMLGIDRDNMVGQSLVRFISDEQRPHASEQLSRLLAGSSPGCHLEVRLNGRRHPIAQLFLSPTHEDGEISGLIVHFIDATEQRNLEAQFAQSQKMQAMGQLAGGVAHDFNNLLTAMIGFSDLLLQRHGPGDPSFADIMQIRQNANRAASLVRQLLAFSRRQALRPRLLNVTDALADLSNLLRRLLGETIELRIVHGRQLGMIRVDPGQFDQVIINLAVNGRDAMPGGGSLTIRTNAVHIAQAVERGPERMPPGDYVVIEVTDTGTGIAPEHLGRIFEPFFSTKEVGAGTGLGLSTVYGIVRQTDGFVFVASETGQGSTFSIYLPRFEADPAPAEVQPTPAAARSADLTGTGTVLLVEDEDAVRLFGARALKNKGYRVIEARSGEQALEVLRSGEAIDILVSDVVMPGMDGVSLARLVRRERPTIKVVLISGYSEDVARNGIDPDAAIHFLPKPFSLKQLAAMVKQALHEPA